MSLNKTRITTTLNRLESKMQYRRALEKSSHLNEGDIKVAGFPLLLKRNTSQRLAHKYYYHHYLEQQQPHRHQACKRQVAG